MVRKKTNQGGQGRGKAILCRIAAFGASYLRQM
jgi:hypothetical protein